MDEFTNEVYEQDNDLVIVETNDVEHKLNTIESTIKFVEEHPVIVTGIATILTGGGIFLWKKRHAIKAWGEDKILKKAEKISADRAAIAAENSASALAATAATLAEKSAKEVPEPPKADEPDKAE